MSRSTILLFTFFLIAWPSRAAEPAPLPTPQQMAWQHMEMTMFLHFGVNTFTDSEWGHGTEDPKIFNPTALDCRQWVKAAKTAGVKMMILTAKHHDGFCLWPTKQTEHCVRNSSWKNDKGDVVREFTQACHEGGMKVGLYLSPWDRNNPTYGTSAYNDYFVKQLEELLTQYGTVDEMWFDGACGEGANGKKQEYDWKRYYETIRKFAPKALVAVCGPDIRWVGNESGVAKQGESSVKNADPSRHFGESGKVWWPAECDVSIRPGWFYHASQDAHVKPLEHLMGIYLKSVGRNSVMLLNVPPDKRGLLAVPDLKRLEELGNAIHDLYREDLVKSAKVERTDQGAVLTWSKPVQFNLINIREDIAKGERIQSYKIQSWIGDHWSDLASGSVVGNRNLIGIGDTEASKIRLVIDKSDGKPALAAFSIHKVQPIGQWGSGSIVAHKPVEASNVHPGGTEFGGDKAVDDDDGTRWATSDDTKECTLDVDLLGEKTIGSFRIKEIDPRITKFTIEYKTSQQAAWQVAYEGTTAGKNFQAAAKNPPKARYVRLHILDVTKSPSIWEFQVFEK